MHDDAERIVGNWDDDDANGMASNWHAFCDSQLLADGAMASDWPVSTLTASTADGVQYSQQLKGLVSEMQ